MVLSFLYILVWGPLAPVHGVAFLIVPFYCIFLCTSQLKHAYDVSATSYCRVTHFRASCRDVGILLGATRPLMRGLLELLDCLDDQYYVVLSCMRAP